MRGMNVALHGLLVLLTTLLVALPLFAQTLEQKRLMYTISPEEKQCRVDRLKELMELVKAAKTEAEMDRYGMLADETRLNKACAAKVAATNTVNNGAVMSIFAEMLTFDRKSGEQWKSPIPVSTSCKAEILKTLSNDTLMLTDFRASLLRAGCSNPSK